MAPKTMSVLVVGCGMAGRAHLRAYQELADKFAVLGFVECDAGRARLVAEEFGLEHKFESITDAFSYAPIDVVDVCSPPHLHCEHIIEALHCGAHVICEKPLVESMESIDLLQAAARRAARHVMPVFQYRYGNGLLRLKTLVDNGDAGPLYLANLEVAWLRSPQYYDNPWRGRLDTELGGAILSHAIHALDALLFLCGDAAAVYASTRTLVNPVEAEDCAVICIEMLDGSLAVLAVTLGSVQEISRFRFCYRNLTAESNLSPYRNTWDPWSFVARDSETDSAIRAAECQPFVQHQGYAGQFFDLHLSLTGGTVPPITLSDARRTLELITAIYMSSAMRCRIQLPLTKQHEGYRGWGPFVRSGQQVT